MTAQAMSVNYPKGICGRNKIIKFIEQQKLMTKTDKGPTYSPAAGYSYVYNDSSICVVKYTLCDIVSITSFDAYHDSARSLNIQKKKLLIFYMIPCLCLYSCKLSYFCLNIIQFFPVYSWSFWCSYFVLLMSRYVQEFSLRLLSQSVSSFCHTLKLGLTLEI